MEMKSLWLLLRKPRSLGITDRSQSDIYVQLYALWMNSKIQGISFN